MTLFDTLKPIAVTLGALLLVTLGAAPAMAQDGTTLTLESQEAQAGQGVDVPIQVTDFNDVGSISLTINYDPNVLSFPSGASTEDLISGAPRSGFTANVPEPGELRISWFDGTGENPINLGDGTLLSLTFSNFDGGSSAVSFADNSEVTDIQAQTIDATYRDGEVAEDLNTVSAGSVQDAGLNQTVSVPLSADNISNVGSVSLEVPFDTDALQFKGIANDSSGLDLQASADNGVVTIGGFNENGITLGQDFVDLQFQFLGDTSSVDFDAASEITDVESNPLSVNFQSGTVSGDEPTVSVSDQAVTSGGTVTVPVETSELRAVGSASIDVSFNASALTFQGSENGLQNFNLQVSNPETGVVRIGGFSANGVDPADNGDRIVDLRFSVDDGFDSGSETTLDFDTGASEVTNPSSVAYNVSYNGGRLVAEAPQFAVSPSEINATVTSGETEEFAATITNEATQVAALEVQVVSVPDFLTLEGVEGGTFTASDSTVVLDPEQSATVTYSFEESVSSTTTFADTIAHETNAPATPTADIPVSITVEVAEFTADVSRSFDNASDPSNYELVALPGAVDVDVAETLTGEQGPEWRAFREVGASDGGDAGLQSYDGSEAFNFRPGRAFWVISQNDWSFSGTVSAVQEGDGTPSIALQEGWNAVSNPLQADLEWSAVQSANGLQEALWRWNGEWIQADTLGSAADGEGYYVFNSAELDSLDLTTASGTPAVATAETASEGESSPQTVRLTASPESGDHRSSVTVGLNEGAEEATTYRAPPAHFGSTALRIAGDESDATYMRMVTPSSEGESAEFDLTLQGEPGTTVTLEAEDLPTAAGMDFSVMLVEESSGTTHDLRSGSATVSVPDDGEGTVQLRALLGAADQLREQTAPEKLTLRPNYPNPFSDQTTIEYAVPEQTDVTVQVYNVLGQKVATLEQDTKTAGTHRLEWDGSGVQSGTYFVRIEANGSSSTQKVTVIK